MTSQHILTTTARHYFGHPLTVPYSSSVPQSATQACPARRHSLAGAPVGLQQGFLKLGPGLELSGGWWEMSVGWLRTSTRTASTRTMARPSRPWARVHGQPLEAGRQAGRDIDYPPAGCHSPYSGIQDRSGCPRPSGSPLSMVTAQACSGPWHANKASARLVAWLKSGPGGEFSGRRGDFGVVFPQTGREKAPFLGPYREISSQSIGFSRENTRKLADQRTKLSYLFSFQVIEASC